MNIFIFSKAEAFHKQRNIFVAQMIKWFHHINLSGNPFPLGRHISLLLEGWISPNLPSSSIVFPYKRQNDVHGAEEFQKSATAASSLIVELKWFWKRIHSEWFTQPLIFPKKNPRHSRAWIWYSSRSSNICRYSSRLSWYQFQSLTHLPWNLRYHLASNFAFQLKKSHVNDQS